MFSSNSMTLPRDASKSGALFKASFALEPACRPRVSRLAEREAIPESPDDHNLPVIHVWFGEEDISLAFGGYG